MLTEAQKTNVIMWLDLLLTGGYEQGQSFLKKVDSEGNATYCCLGIAAEAVLHKEFTPDCRFSSVQAYKGKRSYFCEVLHKEDAEQFGFDVYITEEEVGKLKALLSGMNWGAFWVDEHITRQSALSTLNDNGISFQTIAAVVIMLNWHV